MVGLRARFIAVAAVLVVCGVAPRLARAGMPDPFRTRFEPASGARVARGQATFVYVHKSTGDHAIEVESLGAKVKARIDRSETPEYSLYVVRPRQVLSSYLVVVRPTEGRPEQASYEVSTEEARSSSVPVEVVRQRATSSPKCMHLTLEGHQGAVAVAVAWAPSRVQYYDGYRNTLVVPAWQNLNINLPNHLCETSPVMRNGVLSLPRHFEDKAIGIATVGRDGEYILPEDSIIVRSRPEHIDYVHYVNFIAGAVLGALIGLLLYGYREDSWRRRPRVLGSAIGGAAASIWMAALFMSQILAISGGPSLFFLGYTLGISTPLLALVAIRRKGLLPQARVEAGAQPLHSMLFSALLVFGIVCSIGLILRG